jgi:hypothetical protein
MAHALHQGNNIVTNMFNLGAISKLQKTQMWVFLPVGIVTLPRRFLANGNCVGTRLPCFQVVLEF